MCESNLSPPVEGGFFQYLVGDSVIIHLEWIQLLYIFELYPRIFSVHPAAAHIQTNHSLTELLAGRGVDVRIVCTYGLNVGEMVNKFVKYLVHKYIFVALHQKFFCYGIGG